VPDSEHPQAAIAPLLQAAFGAQSAQVLYVAAKLGLADLICDGHRTPAEIAHSLTADEAAVRRVLRGLVTLGVCHESADGDFRLTTLGDFLRSDHPDSVQSRIILNGEVHYALWADILATVRTGESASDRVFGTPFYEHLVRHPDVGAVFDRAMTSTGGVRYRFRPAVAAYDFGRFDRIVDVGGGNGTLMVELLTTYAGPHGVIFDVPRLANAARKRVEAAGLTARCEFVAGDAFETVPPGADAYVLSNFLISWGDDEALVPLRNCRRAMAPTGKLLLVEWVMPTGDAPTGGFRYWDTVMMDLVMLAAFGSHSGHVRTRAEFDALLGAAGFRLTTVAPTTASVSVIEAVAV
jgi:SAM-dependent methyltransferase